MSNMDKDWRPENWEQIRRELAAVPFVWSPAGPNLSSSEQLIEATASRILEEYLKSMTSETTD